MRLLLFDWLLFYVEWLLLPYYFGFNGRIFYSFEFFPITRRLVVELGRGKQILIGATRFLALRFHLFIIFLHPLILILIFALDVHLSRNRVLHIFDFLVDLVVLRLLELVQEQEGQVETNFIVPHYLLL